MRGTITEINEQRGMVAVETDDGDYSVFEIIGGGDFEVGHEVEWKNATALGGEQIRNLSTQEISGVYFQNHHVAQSMLRELLLY